MIVFPLKKFQECWESKLGLLGEKQVCDLCAMQPPQLYSMFTWNDDNVLTDLSDGSDLSEQGNGAEAAKVSGEWCG